LARFVVTGGAGFIGSHLVDSLLLRGNAVRVVDDLSTGREANVPSGVEFIQGSLVDPDTAARAVTGCEYVLHQAAVPSVPLSIARPRPSHQANIDATFNVLMAARDAGVRRVVFAASSSAYGDVPIQPKREDMQAAPCSPYALQKYFGEMYCAMFAQLYGLETVSLRYFNVFGPRQHPMSPYSGVISQFIRAALSGERPVIYGDGEQTRDFTYIDNVLDGVMRAIDAPDAVGETINIAKPGRLSGRSSAPFRRLYMSRLGWGMCAIPRRISPRRNACSDTAQPSRLRLACGEPSSGLEGIERPACGGLRLPCATERRAVRPPQGSVGFRLCR
jgi:UDP-glucose 4-epimerase